MILNRALYYLHFIGGIFVLNYLEDGFHLDMVERVVTGLGEGVTYPAVFHLLGRWYPKTEKSFWACFLGVAPSIGTVLANGLSPVIIENLRWQSVCYIFGGFGIVWGCFWFLFTTDEPRDNKSTSCVPIDHEELDFIISHQDRLLATKTNPSYKKILTESAFIVIAINHFSYHWGYYVFSSWVPTYLKYLHYDLNATGVISFLPYILMPFVGIPSGIIADKIVASKRVKTVYVRKFFQSLGMFLPAIILIVLSFDNPDPTKAVILMIFALAFLAFTTAGHNTNFLDLSTKHSGVLYSISNTTSTIPGIIGVSITGYILDHSNHNWSIVFLLAAVIFIIAGILFLIFGKGEQIDFDSTTEEKSLRNIDLNSDSDFMEKINPQGGGDYEEAIEIGLLHAVQQSLQPEKIAQVLLIADAPAKDLLAIKRDRSKYGGEDFWVPKFGQPTHYLEQLPNLKAAGIPVHTFYLHSGAKVNFEDIAVKSGGTCRELNINNKDGAQQLTNFITEEVLRKSGGEQGEELVQLFKAKYAVKSFLG